MEKLIKVIPKNSIDEIRIEWKEYRGHKYLDIRTYTEIEDKEGKVATKKGVTVRPDLLPELCQALEQAETGRRGCYERAGASRMEVDRWRETPGWQTTFVRLKNGSKLIDRVLVSIQWF